MIESVCTSWNGAILAGRLLTQNQEHVHWSIGSSTRGGEVLESIVELEGVSKWFGKPDARIEAVSDVTASMFPGEVVALIGPSGCGKTTTLRMIAGLDEPSTGYVRTGLPKGGLGGLSMMFQAPALLDWRTVEGNVALPLEGHSLSKDEITTRVSQILETVRLGDFGKRRPYELSGGMQQRVAVARALVTEPSLLLMDEPFGALDLITRNHMTMELERICSGRSITIVLVTHSISEAVFLGDRILVMSHRPARIAEEVAVPLSRPRTLEHRLSPEARDLENRLAVALEGQLVGE